MFYAIVPGDRQSAVDGAERGSDVHERSNERGQDCEHEHLHNTQKSTTASSRSSPSFTSISQFFCFKMARSSRLMSRTSGCAAQKFGHSWFWRRSTRSQATTPARTSQQCRFPGGRGRSPTRYQARRRARQLTPPARKVVSGAGTARAHDAPPLPRFWTAENLVSGPRRRCARASDQGQGGRARAATRCGALARRSKDCAWSNLRDQCGGGPE